MSTDATRAGSTGITMLARASSRAAVIRTVPGARPAMAPCGVTAAISVSAECQVTVRYTGQPRLSCGVASRRISSPTWSGSFIGSMTMSSARGVATSTRSSAVMPLHVAVTIAVPGPTAVASPPSGSIRSTPGASVVQVTARGGSRVPCSPRITATRLKLSPVSSPAGAGMIEMPPMGLAAELPACDALVRGAGLVGGVSISNVSPPARTWAISSARLGSSSARGAAPSAAKASARRGHRSAGSLASMRRMAASTSGGQSARSARIGGGVRSTCACMTVSVEPANGGAPVTSSYATAPSAY